MNIQELIEKYDMGETSLEEEQFLRDFFAKEKCPAQFQEYKMLFCYFSKEKDIKLDNSFKVEPISGQTKPGKSRFFSRTIILRVAAVMLFFATAGMLAWYLTRPQYTKQEVLLAKEQTDKALLYVSQKLNEAMSQINQMNEIKKNKKRGNTTEKQKDKNKNKTNNNKQDHDEN